MKTKQHQVFFVLFLIGIVYFFLFWPINSQGAKDQYMLSVFSPDEFAQYPHILRMLEQPASSFLQSIYRFVQYKHYYYGYPFYFYSVILALLPLRLAGFTDTSTDLLFLRQMVSVFPMLMSIGFLVYMQTKFQNMLSSVFLFLFLLSTPMVAVNNLWWHPESLVLFFVVLTLFFIQKDNFSFGRYFYLGAIACGLAVATKLIGLFFFLAVPIYIFLGWRQQRYSPARLLQIAISFVLLMVVTFFISNPFLVFKSERDMAIKAQISQSEATSSGFVFSSQKDPALWMPIIIEYYAQPIFLALVCIAALVGTLNKEKSITNLLVLLWSIPFALYLLFFVALRHRYYFIPVMLPLFSAIPNIFDPFLFNKFKIQLFKPISILVIVGAFIILGGQITKNLDYSAKLFVESIEKEANSPALHFFSVVNNDYLARIVLDRKLVIYRSVRVYVADDQRWVVKSRWSPASYSYFERTEPDAIMLWRQEVYDYTNLDAIGNAIQPTEFEKSFAFYQDARNGNLIGYELVYQNDFGMFYLRNDLFEIFIK